MRGAKARQSQAQRLRASIANGRRRGVRLRFGGYHHHIGLNTWTSRGGSPPPPGTTGLFHLAILYPSRRALAGAVRRLLDAGVTIDGASDHGVSEAVYLHNPDRNGIELYHDRPEEQWPRPADSSPGVAMHTAPSTSATCSRS